MFARIEICLAAALLIATAASAGADTLKPAASATPNDPAAADASSSSAPAYSRAATSDPYNQTDFGSSQSFGLAATQMLGAAAACEQLHSNSVSLSGLQAAKNAKATSASARADIDAAQQNMLDPVSMSPGSLKAGAADCDRVGGAFSKLQEIQLHNPNLTHELDEPDAMYPTDNQPPRQR